MTAKEVRVSWVFLPNFKLFTVLYISISLFFTFIDLVFSSRVYVSVWCFKMNGNDIVGAICLHHGCLFLVKFLILVYLISCLINLYSVTNNILLLPRHYLDFQFDL
jgi:hypothetical protein